MTTHRLQDLLGKWHRVARSSSRAGAYVEYKEGVGAMRLWLPGQFKSGSVKAIC